MTPPGPGRPPSRRRLRLSDDYPSPGARRDSLADCTVKVRGAEDRDSHVGEFFTARVLKQLEHPKLVNMKFLNIGLQATNMHVEVWNMHVCVTMHCNATTAVHALDL